MSSARTCVELVAKVAPVAKTPADTKATFLIEFFFKIITPFCINYYIVNYIILHSKVNKLVILNQHFML